MITSVIKFQDNYQLFSTDKRKSNERIRSVRQSLTEDIKNNIIQ